jgi:hypothetical protein
MPRGGTRSGAGRPIGSANRDTAAMRAALADLMDGHVEAAITALSDIARNGQSDAARVSAATAILDRCYGRPAQAVHHDGIEMPTGPTIIQLVGVEPELQSALDNIAAKMSEG